MTAHRRRLLIMRHAKSAFPAGVDDHDRPLNRRGERSARRMARELASLDLLPDHVALSDSRRTQETLWFMNDGLPQPLPSHQHRALYLPSVESMLKVIRTFPSAAETGMILSHNPGCEGLTHALTGTLVRVTTANVIEVTIESGWSEVGLTRLGTHALVRHLRPKELPPLEGLSP